jgi:hypothetical protein
MARLYIEIIADSEQSEICWGDNVRDFLNQLSVCDIKVTPCDDEQFEEDEDDDDLQLHFAIDV